MGGYLLFAAQVFNQNNEIVEMVAQGSRIYLRNSLNSRSSLCEMETK